MFGANNRSIKKTMEKSKREIIEDMIFTDDVIEEDHSNRLFIRVVAKGKRFYKVSFKYTIFDTCYLRNCVFDSCDFTGCRFIGTNFTGATFEKCNFIYAVFDRTQVQSEILDNCAPEWENLQLKFARTLRTNYQSLGDSQAVNKAVVLELKATEIHLKKAWRSPKKYYKDKYKGLNKLKMFGEWFYFKLGDLIWGNGESIKKLLRAVFVILAIMTLYDVISFGNPTIISAYWTAFWKMSGVFLGIHQPVNYADHYLVIISIIRIVVIAFFLSIIIKRHSWR